MEVGPGDSTGTAVSVEEEAVKRNTDCVYFLASPLTCKKGNECEYRHSEGARVNPRDCWFWLNSNCLNPKCSFRHPPLDGLLGTPAASGGSSVPRLQAAAPVQMPAAPHAPAAYGSNKQSVPCIYFQKGHCLKGDRCPFMHGPQPVGNPTPQPGQKVAPSVSETPQNFKKATGTLEKCTTQKKVAQANVPNPMEVPFVTKPSSKAEIAPNNSIAAGKSFQPTALENNQTKAMPTTVPGIGRSAVTKPRSHQGQTLEERFQNGKEVDEFLGESSPGFDVLVDDEVEDSDYYHNEDEFGTTAAGHRERHLNPVNEFDYGTSYNRDSLPKYDREPYSDYGDYDQYGRVQDQFSMDQRRASSERIVEKSSMTQRRSYMREDSPEQIDRSDLRHRLKQRRVNGSRSVTSPDCRSEFYQRDDRYVEEQRPRDRSRRETRHYPSESSIGNRLQGRLMLPGRSSPDNRIDYHSDKEADRGRSWGRSSPGRPNPFLGRHVDRTKRTHEDLITDVRNSRGPTEVRNTRGPLVRRDEVDNLNFAGPKSLAELKGVKASDSSEEQPSRNASGLKSELVSGEQKSLRLAKVLGGHSKYEGSLSFEGPKPLSVILKRKRDVKSEDCSAPSNGEESNEGEGTEQKSSSAVFMATQSEPKKEADHTKSSDEERRVTSYTVGTVEEEDEEEGQVSVYKNKLVHEGQSSAQRGDTLEMEDGMMVEAMEDHEPETSDPRDGELDYGNLEGGDFKTEDENADPEDEYLDDEDGDDFARRIGVMFS